MARRHGDTPRPRRHRSSYQLGWEIGREDLVTNGFASDALAGWRALLPEYKERAPDLMSYTEGYVRGGSMREDHARYEIERSRAYLARRRP